jgi:glycosyltransferase involved in cell wall biosynthesis
LPKNTGQYYLPTNDKVWKFMKFDISIIIPSYNRINLLNKTLDSVVQATKNVSAEIIIVDDGSTIPIVEQISDFNLRNLVIIRQDNSGLTTARYNGLSASNGDYIQFLDSDDLVAPSKFDVQLKELRNSGADISYTDILQCRFDSVSQKIQSSEISLLDYSENPAVFFIKIQPPPHSPIFKRDYLMENMEKCFIPLSREYDRIAEIWFYYNLSIFPAKIVKTDQPLTIVVHHDQERLTDFWELQGLSVLAIQNQFARNLPTSYPYSASARKMVAYAAFETFRRLPYDIQRDFRNSFIRVWKKLGKNTIKQLNGGKYFTLIAYILGPVVAARIIRRFKTSSYSCIKSISSAQFELGLKAILNRFA